MFHNIGPQRIIFIRHGQREDHANPRWRLTAERPHDSPLTVVGKLAAFELGKYLGDRGVVPTYHAVRSMPMPMAAAPTAALQPSDHVVSGTTASSVPDRRQSAPSVGSKRPRSPLAGATNNSNDDENNAAACSFAPSVSSGGGGGDVEEGLSFFCDNIVVLSSPMVRTVETAHYVICGLIAAQVANAAVQEGGNGRHAAAPPPESVPLPPLVGHHGHAGEDASPPYSPNAPSSPLYSSPLSAHMHSSDATPTMYTPTVAGFEQSAALSSFLREKMALMLRGMLADDAEADAPRARGGSVSANSNTAGNRNPNANGFSIDTTATRNISSSSVCVPIYLEPGVMESTYWMNHDWRAAAEEVAMAMMEAEEEEGPEVFVGHQQHCTMKKRPLGPMGSEALRAISRGAWRLQQQQEQHDEESGSEAVTVGGNDIAHAADSADYDDAALIATNPVFMPPSYHAANVSCFVQPTAFPHYHHGDTQQQGEGCGGWGADHGNGGGAGIHSAPLFPPPPPMGFTSSSPSSSVPLPPTPPPPMPEFGFTAVEFGFEGDDGEEEKAVGVASYDVAVGGMGGSSGGGMMGRSGATRSSSGGMGRGGGGGGGGGGKGVVELDILAPATTTTTATTTGSRVDPNCARSVLRHGSDVQMRCYSTAAAIANCPDLHGKTVLVVGHGQSVKDGAQRVVPRALMGQRPRYTSFCDCVRNVPQQPSSSSSFIYSVPPPLLSTRGSATAMKSGDGCDGCVSGYASPTGPMPTAVHSSALLPSMAANSGRAVGFVDEGCDAGGSRSSGSSFVSPAKRSGGGVIAGGIGDGLLIDGSSPPPLASTRGVVVAAAGGMISRSSAAPSSAFASPNVKNNTATSSNNSNTIITTTATAMRRAVSSRCDSISSRRGRSSIPPPPPPPPLPPKSISPTHSFSVREGSTVFGVPHLPPCLLK